MTDNTQSAGDNDVTRKHQSTGVEADKIKGTQAEQSAKIAHTTQAELDHIVDVHEMVVDNSLDGIFDKMGYTKNTDFRKDAIRLITDWHNKQVLEIIGEDEELVIPDYPSVDDEGEPLWSKRAAKEGRKQVIARYHARNDLRAEQRNKLKESK